MANPLELKDIRELIERISQSDFSHFEIEMGDVKLKLERRGAAPTMVQAALAASPAMAAPVAAASPVAPGASPAPSAAAPSPTGASAPAAPTAPAEDLHAITSPIVGTFYRSPNPDADAFVETGSRIKRGQVLCIVEAMKLMNEIESDVDGEVVDILVANGQPVEYGEILFRVRPAA